MENVSRLMTIGFGVILFSASVAVCMIMYNSINSCMKEAENSVSMRRILEVRQLE